MEINKTVINYYRLYTLENKEPEDIQTTNPIVISEVMKSRNADKVYLDIAKYNLVKEKSIVISSYIFNYDDLIFLEDDFIRNLVKGKTDYQELVYLIDIF